MILQIDGPTLFRLVTGLLVNLALVFWVGVQLWHSFVLQQTAPKMGTQQTLNRRFTRRFALPVLLLLLVVNGGALIEQGLLLHDNHFDQAMSPTLLISLVSSGLFGLYWVWQEIVIILALLLATYTFVRRKLSPVFAEVQSWINFVTECITLKPI